MQRWDGGKSPLWLFTPDEFNLLPDGIELECINKSKAVKGRDYIDDDTRAGHIAYGIRNPFDHKYKELFTEIYLKR